MQQIKRTHSRVPETSSDEDETVYESLNNLFSLVQIVFIRTIPMRATIC